MNAVLVILVSVLALAATQQPHKHIRCYNIELKSAHGRYLASTPEAHGIVRTKLDHPGAWEMLFIKRHGGDKIIMSNILGKNLGTTPSGNMVCNRPANKITEAEQFEVEKHGKKIALKNYLGGYLSAHPDGSVRFIHKPRPGKNELWELPKKCVH